MTHAEIIHLINRSLFADLGFMDEAGFPAIRRVFCVWHRGIGRHLISTNTSSGHTRALRRDGRACLYFADDAAFEGVCLTGRCVPHRDRETLALLWDDGDEKYYPGGIDDEDYTVLEFIADSARYYRFDGKGTLSAEEIAALDVGASFENGYQKTHP